MKYRLGLDVGTNSLGWCVLELNEENDPCRIEAVGVRIFSDGRIPKNKATLKAERRAARSARRQRDRYIQRRTFLLSELTKAGLFPGDDSERRELQDLNPIELRARALFEKLHPYEIGRALFHINQRRGFKSNRKDRSEESTSGKVADSVRALYEEMGLLEKQISEEAYKNMSKEEQKIYRRQEVENRQNALRDLKQSEMTFGAFLWSRQQQGKSIRARPLSDSSLYDVYPVREMLEDEFDKIWTAQAQYYPKILTDALKETLRGVIFLQRPLKLPELGQCAFISSEKRCYRAMPTFQRYRIYQEVNGLKWSNYNESTSIIDCPNTRDMIVRLLERPSLKKKNAKLSFTRIKLEIRGNEDIDYEIRLNFEDESRKDFEGNQTSNVMQHEDYVGLEWHNWPLEKQDKFVAVILDDKLTDEVVLKKLQDEFGLDSVAAENCMNASLVDGTANISLKAAGILLDKMRDEYQLQSEAVQAADEEFEYFQSPYLRSSRKDLRSKLPYYGKAFQDGSHIIRGTLNDDDKSDDLKYWGGVTNPTVHIALNQIRKVVNELIDRFGRPYSIAIELGRDLPAGQKKLAEMKSNQNKNTENNERLNQILKDFSQDNDLELKRNRENRFRIKLWEELGSNPSDRFCPFSGERICFSDLFDRSTEIEHILPFSFSLEDSFSNLTICTRQANRDKGNRTPFEAFGDSPPGYSWTEIYARAQTLPKSKRWRFERDAREIWAGRDQDFTERHLNDTRYIGRLAREYLEIICPFNRIDVVTGRLTAILRHQWGLNSILNSNNLVGGSKNISKNRNDHRHHVLDAIVIGMINRSLIQKVAKVARKSEELRSEKLFYDSIDPWKDFRSDVKQVVHTVIVSHRKSHKDLSGSSTDGQLHNETAFGLVSGPDSKEYYEVVTRWPISKFDTLKKLEKIRDKNLQNQFVNYCRKKENSGLTCKQLAQSFASKKGIRRLRVVERKKVIPIQGKQPKPYKAYQGDSNWGIEIFLLPDADKVEWKGRVISRYKANSLGFQPGVSARPHPTAKLVMRLQINDCIQVESDDRVQLLRVQKINQDTQITLVPLYEANLSSRDSDPEDAFNFSSKSPNKLRKLKAKKVHVSATGRVQVMSNS